MKVVESFLTFEVQPKKEEDRKTYEYKVVSKTNTYLGWVKWHAPWRKYCFFPSAQCLFDNKCLTEISEFITALMDARKKLK